VWAILEQEKSALSYTDWYSPQTKTILTNDVKIQLL